MGYGPMGIDGENSSLGDNGFGMYGMHALGGTNQFMPGISNMYSADAQMFYSGTGQGTISSMQGWRDPAYALQDTSLFNMLPYRNPILSPVARGTTMEDLESSSMMEFQTMMSDIALDAVSGLANVASIGGAFAGGPVGYTVGAIGTGIAAGMGKIREASEENYRNMVDISGITNSFSSSSGKFGASDDSNVSLLRALGADSADDLTMNRQENMDLFKETFSQGLMSDANSAQGAIETFRKLKKALLTVQDVTGSTELKETLAEIAKMKQYGFSLDQSTSAIGSMKVAADIAGVKKEDINDLHQSAMYMSGDRSASAQNITSEMMDSLSQMKLVNSFGASSGRLSNTNSYVMAQQEVSKLAEETLYSIGGVDVNQKKIMATETARENGTNAEAEMRKLELMTSKQASIFKREFLATRGNDVSSYFNQAMSDKGIAKRIVSSDNEMSGLKARNPIDLLIDEAISIIKKAGKSVNSRSVMSQIESMSDLENMSSSAYEVLQKRVGIATSPMASRQKENIEESTNRITKATELSSQIRRAEESNSIYGTLVQAKDHVGDFFQNLAGKQEIVSKTNREATEKFGNLKKGSTELLTSEINIEEKRRASDYIDKLDSLSEGGLDQFLNSDVFNEGRTVISESERDNYVKTEKFFEKQKNTFRYSQYKTHEKDEFEVDGAIGRKDLNDLEVDSGKVLNFLNELTYFSSTKENMSKAMLAKNDMASTIYADNEKLYNEPNLTKQQRTETNAMAQELIEIRDAEDDTLSKSQLEIKETIRGKSDLALRQLAKASAIGNIEQLGELGEKYIQDDSIFRMDDDIIEVNESLFNKEEIGKIGKKLDEVKQVAKKKVEENSYKFTDSGVFNKDVADIMEAAKSQEVSRISALVKERGLSMDHLESAYKRQDDKQSDESLVILKTMDRINKTVRKDIFEGTIGDGVDNDLTTFISQDEETKKGLVELLKIAKKVKEKGGDELKDVSVESITHSFIDDGIDGDYNQYLTDSDTAVINKRGKEVYSKIGGITDIWELDDNIAGASMSMKMSSRELDRAKKEALEKATHKVFTKSGRTDAEADEFLAILEKSKTGSQEEKAKAQKSLRDDFGIISKIDKAYKENLADDERKTSVSEKINSLDESERGDGVEKQQLKEAMTTNELLKEVVSALNE